MQYVAEHFTSDEQDILRPYFTNVDGPVFALVNLPEVVKGALFARYSRSDKSLRRLFLDEFVGTLDITGDLTIDASVGLKRAEELYDRVFLEYGDDSVAQLGGVHLACEQASNLLTKVLEWGRLMAYLEQSTRYIAYDSRLGGRYRYLRPPEVLESPLGVRYIGELDALFASYTDSLARMLDWARERYPKEPGDSDFVYKQTIKAKAFDAVRGMLPAATLSNVGIYGTGQGYEQLLLRMRAHPLPEARHYADLMLEELRKVVPVVPDPGGPARAGRRVDHAPRGDPGPHGRGRAPDLRRRGARAPARASRSRTSIPRARTRCSRRSATRRRRCPRTRSSPACAGSAPTSARRCSPRTSASAPTVATSRDARSNAPATASTCSRTTARSATCNVTACSRSSGRRSRRSTATRCRTPSRKRARPRRSCRRWSGRRRCTARWRSGFPEQASYAVSLAYRLRFVMQMNAREAMHLIELRTTPQGHPAYRHVAQEMHRLIAEEAGHRALAAAMSFADHEVYELERLSSERAAETRRAARS